MLWGARVEHRQSSDRGMASASQFRRFVRLSLRARVVLAAALAAAVGGVLAAGLSASLARLQVETNEEKKLREVAADFAAEIEEELNEVPEDDSLEERIHFQSVHGARTPTNIISHELEQLHYLGAQASVLPEQGSRFGARDLALPPRGSCSLDPLVGRRACTVAFPPGGTLTLSVSTADESARAELFEMPMAIGALAGALLGAGLGLFLSRWSLAPWADLRRRIASVDVLEPSLAPLNSPESYPVEVEELRQTIVELVSCLSEALNQAQHFAMQAAHELRTPLATLSAELELLLEEAELPELLRMQRRLSQLNLLVQRLLILAAAPALEEQRGEALDLAELIVLSRESLAEEERERVALNLESEVYLRGDAELIRSLLANAISNALKFSQANVQVQLVSEGTQAVILVRDRGIGIALEEREKVFAPFYRTLGSRNAGLPGYGIGLSLIAHVAKVHGGNVRFEPVVEGALLRVELPMFVRRSPVSRAPRPLSSPPSARSVPEQSSDPLHQSPGHRVEFRVGRER